MSKKWSRSVRYWVFTALALTLIIFIWSIREAIAPLVVASLLAYVLNPAVIFLKDRTRLPQTLAVLLVFLVCLGALVTLPALLIPVLLAETQTLSADLLDIFAEAQALISQPLRFFAWEIHLEQVLPDLTPILSDSLTGFTENAFQLLESTTRSLIWILVILVSTFYFLKDWSHLRDWLLRLPPEEYQADAQRIYLEIKSIWRGYLRGNLALMTIVGIVFSLAWLAIGVPGALLLGVITGILTIIPDLGPAIAAVLAVLVALFEGSTYLPLSNFLFALLVAGVYLGLINIKNIWLRPRIFGRSVHMHEGIVFIAIMAAVIFEGILGALIIVPLLASAGVVGNYLYRRVLGQSPWLEDEAVDLEEERSEEEEPQPAASG